ncbi:TRIM2_3 [Lepeophtheirus salmonis]|uniref:TRIM2_3 n=1 Tax=Lepeophtheirus salmonis TaxID=72036 RepID=A0A7R8CZF5_LEPSM|nr:TRIM2_3 [Lepeophtheirus salmonis]CAF2975477.1 TRIM2_3 [Lepeophtheirus salmonis]
MPELFSMEFNGFVTPRLLSPGSGISSRYAWSGMANSPDRVLTTSTTNNNNSESRDDDSGLGSSDSQSQIIRHIDRNILSCQICLHRYRDPKVLPCLHTFCVSCLVNYIPSESLTITCPLCGQQSIVPQKGIKALQPNYFITHLIEVLQSDREDPTTADSCTVSSYDSEETKSENEVDYNFREADYENNRVLYCSSHSGQSLRFYCEDCDTAICSSCTDIKHREHYTMRVSEAVEVEKEELRSLVDKAYTRVPILKEAIAGVNSLSNKLSEKHKEIEKEIDNVFHRLMKMLENRKGDLLQYLLYKCNDKHETLNRQREELESNLADLYTSCEFVEKALTHGSETEVLLVKKQVGERLAEYETMKVVSDPSENSYLNFIHGPIDPLESSISDFGRVITSSALPFQVSAMGEGIKHCVVGKTTCLTIASRDCRGNATSGPGVEQFLCEVIPVNVSSPSSRGSEPLQLTTELTDMEDGTYELLYTVPFEGQYELSIQMFGVPIKRSPFKVLAVKDDGSDRLISKLPRTMGTRQRIAKRPSSARSFGSQCSRNNPIDDDLCMRIGSRGRGKDSNNQCVQAFDSEKGVFRTRFGIRGRSPGQLQRPTGVAVLANGNYAIADYDNKWVSIFEPTGKFINKIGTGKLLGPKGIAVNSAGQLVVVDNKASSIFIFQTNGKLVQKFGSRGSEPAKFAGPHFVAINSKGYIIVSDFHNHSIKVFDCHGDFQFSFGSNGEGNGQFNAPTGVAVDAQDNILVADWGNSRIQIFDSQGSFLSFVNTLACPLYGPQGLSITRDGLIVVADSGNHCNVSSDYLKI